MGMTYTNVSGIKMPWRRSRPPRSVLTIRITNPRECHGGELCAFVAHCGSLNPLLKHYIDQLDP